MGKLNLITGTYLSEIVESPINGEISVVKSLAFGTYIQVGNLTQSGGVVFEIWKKTLRKIARNNIWVDKALILGLGGGSVAKIISKFWPNTRIIGIDIDPMMVDLGRKYLGLDKIKLNVVIEDANKFVKRQKLENNQDYDLICVDLYVGDEFPEVFESEKFITNVNMLLSDKGTIVFNRLYYDEKRKMTMDFSKKLGKYFSSVDYFFPEANLMLICKK